MSKVFEIFLFRGPFYRELNSLQDSIIQFSDLTKIF